MSKIKNEAGRLGHALSTFQPRRSIIRLAQSPGLRVERADHRRKIVPVSLTMFQLRRMLRLSVRVQSRAAGVGLPLNLFNAMRVVLRRSFS